MQRAVNVLKLACLCWLGGAVAPVAVAAPVETVLKDSEGKDAFLYTPSAEPEQGKTYWLAVGVHGANGKGKGAGGIAGWAEDKDVIVLGPSFENGYQAGDGVHEATLKALVAEVGKTWKLHPKFFLHGFSGGAQFAHRFAFRNPTLLIGVSAHSAGSWNAVDPKNAAAKKLPFVISCGEKDTGLSTKESPMGRFEWFNKFADEMKAAKYDVAAKTWPGVGHSQGKEVRAMSKELFDKVRAEPAAKK